VAHENTTRWLAAVVAADIVGYSRLMAVDEEGTLTRVRALRVDLIDPALARAGGWIVETTGDGLLVEFASSVDAVRCCVAVQRETVAYEAARREAERIRFRVGINLGDIVVDGDDIHGDGVNIATRFEALAEPGGYYDL